MEFMNASSRRLYYDVVQEGGDIVHKFYRREAVIRKGYTAFVWEVWEDVAHPNGGRWKVLSDKEGKVLDAGNVVALERGGVQL